MVTYRTDILSYGELARSGALYVDKTEYVWRLAQGPARAFFLSRPRRFGKSLLVSTLEAFFKGRRELFLGRKIERLAPTEWEAFPVLRLDMSRVSAHTSVHDFEHCSYAMLSRLAFELGVSLKADRSHTMLDELIFRTCHQYNSQVVVLIDEYDKPYIDALGKPYAHDMLRVMQDFYRTLMLNQDKLRFLFVTGSTRFAYSNIFDGYGCLEDISRVEEYNGILGFTREELVAYAGDQLAHVAEKRGLQTDNLLEQMDDWYGGFRFAERGSCLLHPQSVIQFLKTGRLRNYWTDCLDISFLFDLFHREPYKLDSYLTLWHHLEDLDFHNVETWQPVAIAAQSGLLTMQEFQEKGDIIQCRYGFPNFEARQAWSQRMLMEILKDTRRRFLDQEELADALRNGSVDWILDSLRRLLKSLKEHFPEGTDENTYRDLLLIVFTGLGFRAHVEEPTLTGPANLTLTYGDHAYIFEIELYPQRVGRERIFAEAIPRAIGRRYADRYRATYPHVHTIVQLIDTRDDSIDQWREAEA